jgi:RimJ/RimL family protein N-acetyltransferase
MIETARLRLRPWTDDDAPAFAALHADPEVMWDAHRPLTRAESDAKLARYRQMFDARGFSRFAMTDRDGVFLGYVGLLPIPPGHVLGEGVEIGWRLRRAAWGFGYASEGARAVLDDARATHGRAGVFSYTAPDNFRSQAVMARIGLVRTSDLDFTATDGWVGWVWRTP